MKRATELLNRHVVPPLTALSENTYLSAIRAGMVSVVPLTIIGGFFTIIAFLPVTGWDKTVAPYLNLLQVPVTATFGLLGIFVCFSIGYDLGKRLGQEAIVSASMAALVFLMTQIKLADQSFTMDGLGSKGLFTAIIIALVCVWVQKFFTEKNLVIKLPPNVPPVVYESFLSLVPLFFLVVVFWVIRFVLGIDINQVVQTVFAPLLFALNTLPGILVYAFLVTLLWSVGINGDNTLDAIVAPIFLQYLAANVEAASHGQPLPYVTALGFFTSFVNVGGTGATIALALIMLNSKEPGFPQSEPRFAANADLRDQRTDLLRLSHRAESDLHDPLHSECADPDHGQLFAHAIRLDSEALCERSLDHAAHHRPLPGFRRGLESGGVGSAVHRHRHGDLLSVCQGGRAAAAERRGGWQGARIRRG